LAEIHRVRTRMLEMLKNGGPPPDGDWAELALLESARVFTNRHQSIMLPFNATIRAGQKVNK
jgi:NifU-like protein involved in Fe-S cluster formation